ncbi:MAG TPA: PQQ-dependent sugar dehydrogenase [Propionibacteriaceae bacterium]
MTRLRTFAAAATTAALVGLTGCSSASSEPSADTQTATEAASTPPTASPGRTDGLSVSELASGLVSPWGLVSLPDGTTLVSERDSREIVHLDGTRQTTVATLADVEPAGEGGLLGLAASPDATAIYAYFTAERDNRIAAMSWDGMVLGEPRVILAGIPKGTRHNGGRIVIGSDGDLYVGTGDSGDEQLAQDTASLGGKILRITDEGRPAEGNPFGNEVYSYGHRNVQGLAFDDEDRLWASEFGDQTWDELNLIARGANYGWPLAEGSGNTPDLVNPKVVWPTSEASPSGLAYWKGSLWMAALQGERLWQIPVDDTTTGKPQAHLAGAYGRLRSVTVAQDGGSLLLSASNTDGRADPANGDDRLLRLTR